MVLFAAAKRFMPVSHRLMLSISMFDIGPYLVSHRKQQTPTFHSKYNQELFTGDLIQHLLRPEIWRCLAHVFFQTTSF